MKKYIFILACLLSLSGMLKAEDYQHNLQLNLGTGLGTLRYSPENGKWVGGMGLTGNLQYQYMFTREWGVGAGLGFDLLSARAKYSDFNYTESGLTHPDNERDYSSIVHFSDWKERQRVFMLNIPISVIYQHKFTERWSVQGQFSLAAAFPVQSRYKAKAGSYTTQGYFPSTNVTYENLPNHGFDINSLQGQKGDNKLRSCCLTGQLDAGALYKLNERFSLYAGLYFGYGLTNMAKGGNTPLYTGGDNARYVGVLQSTEVRTAHAVTFGVKVGVRFGVAKKLQDPEPQVDTVLVHDTTRILLVDTVIQLDTIYRLHTDTLVIQQQEVAREDSLLQEILMAAHFNTNSYDPIFDDDAEDLFYQLKTAMAQHPQNTITITGHTDATGPADLNMRLGQQRADAFRDALVKRGISASRIQTYSHGEDDPIATNDTPEGRAANRRVELKMVTK